MSPHTFRYILRAIEAFPEPTPDGQDRFWIERELEQILASVNACERLEGVVDELESDLRSAERSVEDAEGETKLAQDDIRELERRVKELQDEIDKHEDALLNV